MAEVDRVYNSDGMDAEVETVIVDDRWPAVEVYNESEDEILTVIARRGEDPPDPTARCAEGDVVRPGERLRIDVERDPGEAATGTGARIHVKLRGVANVYSVTGIR